MVVNFVRMVAFVVRMIAAYVLPSYQSSWFSGFAIVFCVAGALESDLEIRMVKPIILRFLVQFRMVEFYHPRHQDDHPSC